MKVNSLYRQPLARALARFAVVVTIAVLSGQVAIAYPAHAWSLGWFAGLIYGWVVHPWIVEAIEDRRARKAEP